MRDMPHLRIILHLIRAQAHWNHQVRKAGVEDTCSDGVEINIAVANAIFCCFRDFHRIMKQERLWAKSIGVFCFSKSSTENTLSALYGQYCKASLNNLMCCQKPQKISKVKSCEGKSWQMFIRVEEHEMNALLGLQLYDMVFTLIWYVVLWKWTKIEAFAAPPAAGHLQFPLAWSTCPPLSPKSNALKKKATETGKVQWSWIQLPMKRQSKALDFSKSWILRLPTRVLKLAPGHSKQANVTCCCLS